MVQEEGYRDTRRRPSPSPCRNSSGTRGQHLGVPVRYEEGGWALGQSTVEETGCTRETSDPNLKRRTGPPVSGTTRGREEPKTSGSRPQNRLGTQTRNGESQLTGNCSRTSRDVESKGKTFHPDLYVGGTIPITQYGLSLTCCGRTSNDLITLDEREEKENGRGRRREASEGEEKEGEGGRAGKGEGTTSGSRGPSGTNLDVYGIKTRSDVMSSM